MLSNPVRKSTYVKKINSKIYCIYHTVIDLIHRSSYSTRFSRLSIYKSLTKNYLVVLSPFLNAKQGVETKRIKTELDLYLF